MTSYKAQYFCNISEYIYAYKRLHETSYILSGSFIELIKNGANVDYYGFYYWNYSSHTTRRGYYPIKYGIYNRLTNK